MNMTWWSSCRARESNLRPGDNLTWFLTLVLSCGQLKERVPSLRNNQIDFFWLDQWLALRSLDQRVVETLTSNLNFLCTLLNFLTLPGHPGLGHLDRCCLHATLTSMYGVPVYGAQRKVLWSWVLWQGNEYLSYAIKCRENKASANSLV